MIDQLNIYGITLLEATIERIKSFEPPEGYFLAFSGGKDSVVIKALADMAGVKYDAHYQLTSVDPPELVQFVKSHKDVQIDCNRYPDDYKNEKLRGKQITMWNLIPEKGMPPTRLARYCCEALKESAGHDRFVMTGVRKAESVRRAKNRGGLELAEKKSHKMTLLDPDNPTPEVFYHCQTWARKVLNPIYDWTTDEVWEFIHRYDVPYCKLYDEGFQRLGCIGCPMAGKHREEEFKRYPKFKRAYIRAFDRMIQKQIDGGGERRQTGDNGVREIHQRRETDTTLKAQGKKYTRGGYLVRDNGLDMFKDWMKGK